MLFSSGFFLLVFLPVTMVIYWLVITLERRLFKSQKKTFANTVILVASVIFYSWGEPIFVLVLIASIIINYVCGMAIAYIEKPRSKFVLVLSVVINVGVLFVFKYLTFLSGEIADLCKHDSFRITISLPIGISFYTFQIMSYIFDVYYNRVPAQKNLAKLMLYIMMFPQLIAGPIVRYSDIVDHIDRRKESFQQFYDGMLRFIVGLSKKVLVADLLGGIADKIFISSEYSALPMVTAWIGAIAYTLEIYYDFSGYSDMAIGVGLCFGFRFKENFNYPYTSYSISDFWKRWHISLTDWFREYVYFPLGGNRCSSTRHVLNIFIVWMLTGIWHGANWTFIAWGFIYFVILVFEKKINILGAFPKLLRWTITMVIVVFEWVIFRSNNLSSAISYIGSMIGKYKIYDKNSAQYLANSVILIVIAMFGSTSIMKTLIRKIENESIRDTVIAIGSTLLIILSLMVVINGEYSPFIYFNF